MSRKFSELQNRMSLARRLKNDEVARGMLARLDGKPLDEMQSLNWKEGWGQADQEILAEWASKNNIGTLVRQ
jgi:hypothetical protein